MTEKEFFRLMLRRNGRNAAALDARIERECAAEMTVVCCDSSGFSKKTHEHGIIEFMDNMTKCHVALEKIVARHGGITLSDKADNLMLIFEDSAKAVACSIDMHRWLKKRNVGLPEYKQYNICIGIHHGALLRFAEDAYGPAVNVAFKLGEDIAGKDELLVTGPVNAVIKKKFRTEYSKHVTLGGVGLDIYKVKYR
jgi:class 3 adenylate cyclase